MITIYGTSKSRTARCLWALEEIGVAYEHVPTGFGAEGTHSAQYQKINPNKHIPALDDGGTVLWESMAINLYLAEKYSAGKLWPQRVEDHGQTYKWSFWGMTEAEPHLVTLLRQRIFFPAEKRSAQADQEAETALKAPLAVLDQALAGRQHLLDGAFSIADLNLSSILSFAPRVKLDLSPYPNLSRWLEQCLGRPANAKVRSLP